MTYNLSNTLNKIHSKHFICILTIFGPSLLNIYTTSKESTFTLNELQLTKASKLIFFSFSNTNQFMCNGVIIIV